MHPAEIAGKMLLLLETDEDVGVNTPSFGKSAINSLKGWLPLFHRNIFSTKNDFLTPIDISTENLNIANKCPCQESFLDLT